MPNLRLPEQSLELPPNLALELPQHAKMPIADRQHALMVIPQNRMAASGLCQSRIAISTACL